MHPSKLISDHNNNRISFMNFPEFLKIFSVCFVLRFPVKGKLQPNLSNSRSKKSFHLLCQQIFKQRTGRVVRLWSACTKQNKTKQNKTKRNETKRNETKQKKQNQKYILLTTLTHRIVESINLVLILSGHYNH